MHIEQILAKDIDRPLDGVVKASNSAQLENEVSEYVITDEVAGHLTDLLEAYTYPGGPQSNGVWIAGFFGSGKSHLLKMLAHLLGDVSGSELPREAVVQEFVSKLPDHQASLKGLLERSAAIPAHSLLFNIDEKVDKNEKDQPDALLKVFVQVFYELSGFFGKTPYIARFERDLTKLGLFDQFRESFASHYGKPWEQGRELAVFAEPAVEKAYAEVTGTHLHRPLTAYRDDFTLETESFAEEVAEWLDTQPAGTRIGFYVDEIGQFIGQDTGLMLGLQGIAEALFSRCRGRAWVLVTSQEVMDSIIGDRTRAQKQDFSKIQARFDTQLKLDSKNVREVVSKRLLEKTPDGAQLLTETYDKNADRFRSLFTFQDQRTYVNYATADDFVATYPFVDYQFELFHDALRGLSDFNAFTGRHSSVGERSLLGVTRDIGSELKSAEVGALATFDMFYDGIEKSVNSAVKQNVLSAARNIEGTDRDFALRVLKALLMTKYIEQFEATPQALAVLLTSTIDTNVSALHAEIERVLKLLEKGSYVQRTGTSYAYLTNEEQDVEKAIKAQDLNPAAVKKLLNDEIVRASGVGAKVRYDATGVDLGLARILDGERQGRSEPLNIHFVTPYAALTADEVKQQSIGAAGTLFVVLDLTDRTRDDLDLHVRTQGYIQLQTKSALPESRKRIIDSHERANVERLRAVLTEIREAVTCAQFIHNGTTVDIGSGGAKERVHLGLQVAIESLYHRINEARGASSVQETDLNRIMRDEKTLEIDVVGALDQLADAVVVQVRNAELRQVQSNVGALIDTFAAPPYGWSMISVLAAIAHAVVSGRLRLTLDTRNLVRTEIAAELRNTKKHRLIGVTEIRDYDPAKVRKLQKFYSSYRDTGEVPSTTDELIDKVRNALAEDVAELESWAAEPYPFTGLVTEAGEKLRESAYGHDDDWYLGEFLGRCDELLDLKEDLLDPIRGFMRGQQRSIVDAANQFLDGSAAELDSVDEPALVSLREALAQPTFFRGNTIPQIKATLDRLIERVEAAVATDREALRSRIEQRLETLTSEAVFRDASVDAQRAATQKIRGLLDGLGGHTSRGQLALAGSAFESAHQSVIEDLIASRTPADSPDDANPASEGDAGQSRSDGGGAQETSPGSGAAATATRTRSTIRLQSVTVPNAPTTLTTTDEVDDYLDQLRNRLHAEVEQGKTVIL